MDTNTGEFHKVKDQGEAISRELLYFGIGEEIGIKGYIFIVDDIDVINHKLILKSKKRLREENKKNCDELSSRLNKLTQAGK